ncbi:hypothetical protein AGMMS49991_10600 [Spirochaetia bacterium]|nr:hypothetical protein AGMMS49991_10600 [Spirochaetia bacterium]
MKQKYCFLGICFLFLCVFSRQGLYADLTPSASIESNAVSEYRFHNPRQHHGHGGGDLLINLFGWIWLFNNFYLEYGNYPYEEGGYIRRPWDTSENSDYIADPISGKPYWFSASASPFYLHGVGLGPWLSFSGNIYKFFGPYIDVFLLTSVTGDVDVKGGVRAGLHFSLFQSNVFNWTLYSQWLFLYGQWPSWYGSTLRNGATLGFEFRFYPFKPLTLRAKTGFQFLESSTLGEFEAEIGFMIKAWEIYGGYRWLGLDEETDFSLLSQGPYLGVRRYF